MVVIHKRVLWSIFATNFFLKMFSESIIHLVFDVDPTSFLFAAFVTMILLCVCIILDFSMLVCAGSEPSMQWMVMSGIMGLLTTFMLIELTYYIFVEAFT